MLLHGKHRRFLGLALDVAAMMASIMCAFLLRFDFAIPPSYALLLGPAMALAVPVKLAACWFYGCDRTTWRFFSVPDLRRLILASVAGSALFTITAVICLGQQIPRSIYSLDFLICLGLTATLRLSIRLVRETFMRESPGGGRKNLMLYGTGDAALKLIREIQADATLHCVGLIDDDLGKFGTELLGVRVLGRGRDLPGIVETFRRKGVQVGEIVIAMPAATGRQINEVLANCHAANVPCKTVPSLREILANRDLSSQIRSLRVEDLLGREPVQLDETQIRVSIEGKSVMVTGGGGSIGSELCHQIAGYRPERLVIFERSESDLFRIHNQLTRKFPAVHIEPEIGDIRDPDRVSRVLRQFHVKSVFHAAAYKHVPVMERHIVEAVRNNVFGTRNLVDAASAAKVERFLMISSDKAVNPTSVMGVTKRIAELIVSAMPLPTEGGRTTFVSVRFGNVLGSNGSVVPLFQEQINMGGPVTVTHPDMRRYFMTIPEAVQLVLQASTMGQGSEIFVLDMGEPIYIVDMARNMIQMSGKVPDKDIEIRFVGLRPGEKLFEELVLSGEDMLPTYHEKIRIFKGARQTRAQIDRWIDELAGLAARHDDLGILETMQRLVPEYTPARRKSAAARQLLAAR